MSSEVNNSQIGGNKDLCWGKRWEILLKEKADKLVQRVHAPPQTNSVIIIIIVNMNVIKLATPQSIKCCFPKIF